MSEQVKKRNPWRKGMLISVLVLAVVFAIIYWIVATDTFSDTKDRKAAYTVNAFDFLKEFKQDEKAASKKYGGKIIAVNGRVSAVEPADTTLNIKFTDSASGDYIIFAFQSQHVAEARTLKAGDSVSIKAAYSDYMHSEILDVYSITFQRSTLNK
ncbi:MAG: hypothetical protein JNN00_02240 [Chitinophagaceae bacterium]|nr:hypothetical protein [Chitinophagaceae bacterium]